jgi:hypothetical protein
MRWRCNSSSEAALQRTVSPISSGTIWLGIGIIGKPASAKRRFNVAALLVTLSFGLALPQVADAAIAGGKDVVKMQPGAWPRRKSTSAVEPAT